MLALDLLKYQQLKTKFLDYVKIRLISQLINGISGVLQKLLRYFNGTLNEILLLLLLLLSLLFLFLLLLSSPAGKLIILFLLS